MRPWQRRDRIDEILNIAKSQFEEPEAGFPVEDLLAELKTLSGKKSKSVSFLKATILLCFGAKIRPTRTRQFLGFLRKKCRDDGNVEEFSNFEAFLKNKIGRDVLIGHEFSPNSFDIVDNDDVWERAKNAFEMLKPLNMEMFLSYGALLGITRDQSLIPHDDDIDFAIKLKATDAKSAAIEWVRLRKELELSGALDADKFKDLEILKIKSNSTLEIDLFPCWIEDGRAFLYPFSYGELSETDIFPTVACGVTGLPVPAFPEVVLEQNYGVGWKIPDPYFKFHWAQAKRQFEVFRETLVIENKR